MSHERKRGFILEDRVVVFLFEASCLYCESGSSAACQQRLLYTGINLLLLGVRIFENQKKKKHVNHALYISL